jgi:NAD dependent epimerase/dehydratase family enzyme
MDDRYRRSNATFAQELGRALHRPALLRIPAAPLRLLAGDLEKVFPEKALSNGFVFRHPNLRKALEAILPAARSQRSAQLDM